VREREREREREEKRGRSITFVVGIKVLFHSQ
jgi:hypothetical protein